MKRNGIEKTGGKHKRKGMPRILVKKDLKIKALGTANLDPNQNPLKQIKRLRVELPRQSRRDFPGGPVVQNLPGNAGDMGSIPGPGRAQEKINS